MIVCSFVFALHLKFRDFGSTFKMLTYVFLTRGKFHSCVGMCVNIVGCVCVRVEERIKTVGGVSVLDGCQTCQGAP